MSEWGKLFTNLLTHDKWLAASTGGRALWVNGFMWVCQHDKDGEIPASTLPYLPDGKPANAADLVRVGLWDKTATGWVIHNWAKGARSKDDADAQRTGGKRGGSRAMHNRWHIGRNQFAEGCCYCEADLAADNQPITTDKVTLSKPYDASNNQAITKPYQHNDNIPITEEELEEEKDIIVITNVITDYEIAPLTAAPPPARRGSRIPESWQPTPELVAQMAKERPDLDMLREIQQFKDFWESKTGANATKLDWGKTFRVWCRNARVGPANPHPAQSRGMTGTDRANSWANLDISDLTENYQQTFGELTR